MAQPKTLKFGKFIIQLEDPEDAGEFIAPCAFTQKGLEFTANVNTQIIPDCDNPDAAPWEATEVASLGMRLNASGLLALENLALWRTRFFAATSFPARIKVDETLANGGGYYAGKIVLTSFNQTAQLGNKAEVAVAGQGDGAWTWTPAAA